MLGRSLFLVLALVAGVVAASLFPGLPQAVRRAVGLATEIAPAPTHAVTTPEPADDKRTMPFTQEQIEAAGIEFATAHDGVIARRLIVPGTIVPHADRIAHVSVKLSGTVAELHKRPGDIVTKDEVLGIIESRELADAKSEYLATKLTSELQQDLYERDKALWEKRFAPEQQFLRSRNLAAQSKMRFDIARQKLLALGVTEREISNLPEEPEAQLRRQEVRSPIAGRVVERKVELGMAMGRDNLETELFVVVDLDRVWVDLVVSPADLPAIREGQSVIVSIRGIKQTAEGKIAFISPLLDRDTRSARVVAEIANDDGVWRPGSFATVAVAVDQQAIAVAVPAAAVQTIAGEKVVFVRNAEGFEKRPVVVGRSDDRLAEIVTGLQEGEVVAIPLR
jgi:cobalt-zinc-cadmium efflux system membrane fusion protein